MEWGRTFTQTNYVTLPTLGESIRRWGKRKRENEREKRGRRKKKREKRMREKLVSERQKKSKEKNCVRERSQSELFRFFFPFAPNWVKLMIRVRLFFFLSSLSLFLTNFSLLSLSFICFDRFWSGLWFPQCVGKGCVNLPLSLSLPFLLLPLLSRSLRRSWKGRKLGKRKQLFSP